MSSAAHQQLSKLFGGVSDGQDDARLDEMIRNTDSTMRLPARTMLDRIGLGKSVAAPFALLDHACGIGPVAAELEETVDKQVLAESRILCADFNGNLVDMLKRRAALKGWLNVETASLDAQVGCAPPLSPHPLNPAPFIAKGERDVNLKVELWPCERVVLARLHQFRHAYRS